MSSVKLAHAYMLYDDAKKLQRLLYYVYLFVSMLYFTAYDIVVRPIDYCSVSFTWQFLQKSLTLPMTEQ